MQTVDLPFSLFLDELILNTTLPPSVIVKLLERVTDRVSAIYLMPNQFFLKKYEEIRTTSSVFGEAQIRQLAAAFDVSVQSARYRLEECLGKNRAAYSFMTPRSMSP
jgi:Zn-dependent peptidase ImmA (M78 family)